MAKRKSPADDQACAAVMRLLDGKAWTATHWISRDVGFQARRALNRLERDGHVVKTVGGTGRRKFTLWCRRDSAKR